MSNDADDHEAVPEGVAEEMPLSEVETEFDDAYWEALQRGADPFDPTSSVKPVAGTTAQPPRPARASRAARAF